MKTINKILTINMKRLKLFKTLLVVAIMLVGGGKFCMGRSYWDCRKYWQYICVLVGFFWLLHDSAQPFITPFLYQSFWQGKDLSHMGRSYYKRFWQSISCCFWYRRLLGISCSQRWWRSLGQFICSRNFHFQLHSLWWWRCHSGRMAGWSTCRVDH